MLPAPRPIKTNKIPGKMIGPVLQIIEFHRIFANAFGEMQFGSGLRLGSFYRLRSKISHFVPVLEYDRTDERNLTLGDMEQVLYSNSSNATFCDMLFYYVQALRYCHENEVNEAEVGPGKAATSFESKKSSKLPQSPKL